MFNRWVFALVGVILSFSIHASAWGISSSSSRQSNCILGFLCLPGIGNFFGNPKGTSPDWQGVLRGWRPGKPFCISRVVCFPVQVSYVIPPGGELFAHRPGRFHAGEDYAVSYGTPVYSAFNGVVTKAWRNQGACGDGLEIQVGNFFIQRFCHVAPQVSSNQRVYAGQVVGTVNTSGRSSGPHLHCEAYVNGRIVSFEQFLRNFPGVAQAIAASGIDENTDLANSEVPWQELDALSSHLSRGCNTPNSPVLGWYCLVKEKQKGTSTWREPLEKVASALNSPSPLPALPQFPQKPSNQSHQKKFTQRDGWDDGYLFSRLNHLATTINQ